MSLGSWYMGGLPITLYYTPVLWQLPTLFSKWKAFPPECSPEIMGGVVVPVGAGKVRGQAGARVCVFT